MQQRAVWRRSYEASVRVRRDGCEVAFCIRMSVVRVAVKDGHRFCLDYDAGENVVIAMLRSEELHVRVVQRLSWSNLRITRVCDMGYPLK